MKDTRQILDDSLDALVALSNESRFNNAFNMSVDITHVSALADFSRGVLMGEILENVFGIIMRHLKLYDVPSEDANQVTKRVTERLQRIKSSYNNSNASEFYEAIESLQFLVTKFQFHCHSSFKPTPAEKISTIRNRAD